MRTGNDDDRRRRTPRKSPSEIREEKLVKWVPRTRTGKLVQSKEITTIDQLYERNLPILEPQIIDVLVPDVQEEVLDVRSTSRTTNSGRKRRFMVTAVVGNKNGYVGVGIGGGLNVRPAIEKAVENAKLKMVSIRMGCGSWECGCNGPHSVPYEVTGKSGSVRITLKPAPRGTGLVAGSSARKVLQLAGMKDVWTDTKGDTRTVFNFAMATLDALKNIRKQKYHAGEKA